MKRTIYGLLVLISILGFNACTNDNTGSEREHIKVFFSANFKDENSILQPFENWYLSTNAQQHTLKELYQDGWRIETITKINASAQKWQMLFFMKINDTNYNVVKSKYEEEVVKKNKPVPLDKGL